MRNRSWASWVSVAALVGLAVHGLLTATTLGPDDRSIFGLQLLDARPIYVAAAVLAVLCIPCPRLRPWWLFLMSVTTLGRATSIVVLGTTYLDRAAEWRAALGWILLWFLGILAVLVLEAAAAFREG